MRSRHISRLWLPDDRLVYARVTDEGFAIEYRRWHIDQTLVTAIDDLSSLVTDSGVFDWAPTREEWEPPQVTAWLERSFVLSAPLTMRVYCSPGQPIGFEVGVRADMIEPGVVREVNEYALPKVCQLLALSDSETSRARYT